MEPGNTGFEVLELLGEGGFGRVYRARYHGEGGFRKLVAIKLLHPGMGANSQVQRRLRDEARILGLLRHRAIVRVDRLLELDGRWVIVEEYVRGLDLADLMRRTSLPPHGAIELLLEVVGALWDGWTAQDDDGRPLRLLHRDIKPSNIRLTPAGEVKLIDYGIARADFEGRESLTMGAPQGTVAYMSPERLAAADYGLPSDIYSLGAVLYELVRGQRFGRTSMFEESHRQRVADAQAAMVAELGDSLRALPALVADMIDWDPSERPSLEELERQARGLLENAPGASLSSWCRSELGGLLEAQPASHSGDLTGSFLTERTSTDEPLVSHRSETIDFGLDEPGQAPIPPVRAKPAVEPSAGQGQLAARPARPGCSLSLSTFGMGMTVTLGAVAAVLVVVRMPPEADPWVYDQDRTSIKGDTTVTAIRLDVAALAPHQGAEPTLAADLTEWPVGTVLSFQLGEGEAGEVLLVHRHPDGHAELLLPTPTSEASSWAGESVVLMDDDGLPLEVKLPAEPGTHRFVAMVAASPSEGADTPRWSTLPTAPPAERPEAWSGWAAENGLPVTRACVRALLVTDEQPPGMPHTASGGAGPPAP